MSFTMLVFEELLDLKKDCNTFAFDSEQYEKCIELKKSSAKFLEQLEADNMKLFEYFKKLQDDPTFQKHLQITKNFHTLIDENIDNYIDPIDQEVIKDMFFSLHFIDESNNYGFTPPE